jgi:hypothetical protein
MRLERRRDGAEHYGTAHLLMHLSFPIYKMVVLGLMANVLSRRKQEMRLPPQTTAELARAHPLVRSDDCLSCIRRYLNAQWVLPKH